MIGKITPRVVTQTQPIRANLKKSLATAGAAGLAVLAGSSMSNMGNGPKLEPHEMVIPGGLEWQEHAYYCLTGKLPGSVYERWYARGNDYIAKDDDQIVTVNIGGRYVGDIVERPRDAERVLENENDYEIIEISGVDPETVDPEAFKDIAQELTEGLATADPDKALDDEDKNILFEIWKHLAGFPD